MSAADLLLLVMVGGLTAYALLAGADFGAGVWDLLARGRDAGDARTLIAGALGPVWEANHVWLIFVIVAMFSGFPPAFGVVGSTLELPLVLALVGIVLRGAAYVYRAYGAGAAGPDQWWGHVFAAASTVTPFALGVCGAALATGDLATDDPLAPLTNPFGLVSGVFAVVVTAFLAAVYLCRDAASSPATAHLVPYFRRRALGGAVVAGMLAAVLLPLLWREAPVVADRFADRSPLFVALSAAGGIGALTLVWRHRFVAARLAAGLAVAAVLWGWAAAQYPDLVVGHSTVSDAAAPAANIQALLLAIGFGMVALVPALWMLFRMFSRPELPDPRPAPDRRPPAAE
ncbi:cytochrome d ubiquinol oxidase subunit II [Frankia sp. CNm7]|uniref:Cytochrome d ubiquinol oxidase subunit II n=1 Tax=Frankia nepalensis TaxID=1836974 RepID=A0A937RGD6_9ACTN|nr:cytochrome d ubiquinol oxidase subunit II [Frankia nepalensis]MBL7498816.1 cytochrome d ubiquinol oxidase subunit II [Frankia nepalensis]MBL7508621.1 cytochrome d ubiquinol oxidase subunit II [Frankia nepalensis]MBL7517461.1 cytochrome d ubiquinol oxidase subunit II [Frankia nepalensis]MBL7629707.1 cytochrome d ubiquinol oxidase subunit II [Frankia nepalensis]